MSDIESLLSQAYEHFAQKDFALAYKKFIELENLVGIQPQLTNDIAVTLYKLGELHEAIRRFKHASELDGSSIIVDNLIDILDDQNQSISSLQQQIDSIYQQQSVPAQPQRNALLAESGDKTFAQALEMWCDDSAEKLFEFAQSLSDEAWFNHVIASADSEPLNDFLMPRFAPEDTQRMFVGSSGRVALGEGARFVEVLLRYARANNIDVGSRKVAIGDFGSGWGRYTRFMLKYAHPDNLYGLEVQPKMVERCRKEFGRANFIRVNPYPPTTLRDGLLDMVFGYSVFSHLAPACADAWISEFARIVRPGGLVAMTTQGRRFIDFCREKRVSGDLSHPWFKCLAESFVDEDRAYRDYDQGGFLHSSTTSQSTYGESLISRGYIEKNWLEHFDLVDFIDDPQVLPQALFVLKRKAMPKALGWASNAGSTPTAICSPQITPSVRTPKILFIAMSPRTGSTALCSALTATGLFGDVIEYFNPRNDYFDPSKDIYEYWRNIRMQAENPSAIQGLKISWLDFKPLADTGFDRVNFADAAFVYLDRRDQLLQAVSIYRAKQTAQWHKRPGDFQQSIEKWDITAIANEYTLLSAEKAGWADYFSRNRIQPLCIDYADIEHSLINAVRSIYQFCGLDLDLVPQNLQSEYVKFETDCPEEILIRLRETLTANDGM